MGAVPCAQIGQLHDGGRFVVNGQNISIDLPIETLKSAWQAPLSNFA